MHSLASVLLLLMMSSPLPVPYIITKQKLSKECRNMFMYDLQNTCPNPEKAYDLDLQEVCCNSSHTLKFHCQVHDDMLFPACLPEETCKPGFSCRIVQGSDGLPKLTQEPCCKGFFASENRSSVSQIYPFCRDSHTVCRNTGQTVFCEGDSTSDTRCMCKDGYSTRSTGCDEAFTQHSVCSCIPADTNITYCPAWKHSDIPLCSQLSPEQLLIKMTDCLEPIKPPTPSEVTESITAFGTTTEGSTAFGTTEQPATSAPPQADNKSTAMLPWQITVIIVALLIVAAVAVGIIFWPKFKDMIGRVKYYTSVRH